MNDEQNIQGRHVVLRPATPEDEPKILDLLLRSDVTPSLLGPPLFPERPVPPPEDAGERFDPHYLDGTAPHLGRCFLILVDGERGSGGSIFHLSRLGNSGDRTITGTACTWSKRFNQIEQSNLGQRSFAIHGIYANLTFDR